MENTILVNISTDHAFECDTNVIGRQGEGDSTKLEITIPEKLVNCSVYLDFEMPNSDKLRTPKLEIENGVAVYTVAKYLLTERGELKVQLVFVNENGATWKSSKKRFNILKSINAEDEIPIREDFITEAQKVLDALSQEVADIVEMLSNNQDFVDAIIKNIEEATYVKTITGERLRFFFGTQAKYDSLTDTDNLFAIITDDPTKDEIFAEIEALKVADETSKAEMQQALENHAKHEFAFVTLSKVTNGESEDLDMSKLTQGGVYLLMYYDTGRALVSTTTGLFIYNPNDEEIAIGFDRGRYATISYGKFTLFKDDGTVRDTLNGYVYIYKMGEKEQKYFTLLDIDGTERQYAIFEDRQRWDYYLSNVVGENIYNEDKSIYLFVANGTYGICALPNGDTEYDGKYGVANAENKLAKSTDEIIAGATYSIVSLETIPFTIDNNGTTVNCTANGCMTWAEWLASDYHTNSSLTLSVSGERIMDNDDFFLCSLKYNEEYDEYFVEDEVSPTDVIEYNGLYCMVNK